MDELTKRAREIHERVLVLDAHVDVPPNFATSEVDPGQRGPWQVDLPKLAEGHVDAVFLIAFIGQGPRTEQGYRMAEAGTLQKIHAIRRMALEQYPAQITFATSAAEVRRLHSEGRRVACLGIENGYALGRDLRRLAMYHELGARYLTLTHVGHNDLADSADPLPGQREAEHGGLSHLGKDAIAEMNRLGIMVDVSHVSRQACLDAAAHSKAPIIASHSSTRALSDLPRNMADDQLDAVKATGGVVQITALDHLVRPSPPEKIARLDQIRDEVRGMPGTLPEKFARYRQRIAEVNARWPLPTVAQFVDHIDYAVDRLGIDHVGISSDFDGGGGLSDWYYISETPVVTTELVRRGYTEADIAKLWGENFLRAWEKVDTLRV